MTLRQPDLLLRQSGRHHLRSGRRLQPNGPRLLQNARPIRLRRSARLTRLPPLRRAPTHPPHRAGVIVAQDHQVRRLILHRAATRRALQRATVHRVPRRLQSVQPTPRASIHPELPMQEAREQHIPQAEPRFIPRTHLRQERRTRRIRQEPVLRLQAGMRAARKV